MKEQQQVISVDFQGIFEVNKQLQIENSKLKTQLEYERKLRLQAETELVKLKAELPKIKKKKTPEEKAKLLAEQQERQRTGLTSSGKKIATKREPVKSYTEFELIRQELKKDTKHGEMYSAIWALGCAMGIRPCDVLSLKWCDILDNNRNFKDEIKISESKTIKRNEFLSTDAVRFFIQEYTNKYISNRALNEYLFKSQKQGSVQSFEKTVTDHIKNVVNRVLSEDRKITAYSMRHTFANIVYCHGNELPVTQQGIDAVKACLNHSSEKVTQHYLGLIKQTQNAARIIVSDFLLGNKDDILAIPNGCVGEYENTIKEFIESEIL